MDPNTINICHHDTRCPNCLSNTNVEHNHPADARRCPARLQKYGTARENKCRAMQSDNPWFKAKPKKPKTKPPTTTHNKPANDPSNRYEPLNQTSTPNGHNLNPRTNQPPAPPNPPEC